MTVGKKVGGRLSETSVGNFFFLNVKLFVGCSKRRHVDTTTGGKLTDVINCTSTD